MRRFLLTSATLAAISGVSGVASAAPVSTPLQSHEIAPANALVQQADWHGDWRYREWRRHVWWERHHDWRRWHRDDGWHGYYGYR